MCYSPEVSIGTFGFVSVICYILWQRGTGLSKALALILLAISAMQLLEFGIWSNLECGPANKTLTFMIPLLLYVQPLVVFCSVSYFKASWLPNWMGRSYLPLIGIYLAFFPFYLAYIWPTIGQCTIVGPMGHLEWPMMKLEANSEISHFRFEPLYYMAMIAGLGTLKNTAFSAMYLGFSTASWIYLKRTVGHAWSSVWCHFVNALAVGALVMT